MYIHIYESAQLRPVHICLSICFLEMQKSCHCVLYVLLCFLKEFCKQHTLVPPDSMCGDTLLGRIVAIE